MNWFAIVTLIINVLVLIFFILIAIVLNQVRHDKDKYPNVVTVSSGNLTALWIGAIIFAVIAGIQVLASIGAIIWPEYFGQEKCKKGVIKHMTYTGVPQGVSYQAGQPAVVARPPPAQIVGTPPVVQV